MTKKITKPKNIESVDNENEYMSKVIRLNALACNDYNKADFDLDAAMEKSKSDLLAIGASEGFKAMLGAQMLAIHRLQQLTLSMANSSLNMPNQQYYTNSCLKLANCFTQQANLLHRLQETSQQKITVERMEVQNGGQAVVGNININQKQHKDL